MPNNLYKKSILNKNEAIYICDDNGFITLYNKAAADLWGREPIIMEDMYCGAKKAFNIAGDEIGKNDLPVAIAVKQNKPIDALEVLLERPDGTRRKILQSSTPIFDHTGKLKGAINLLIDVTE